MSTRQLKILAAVFALLVSTVWILRPFGSAVDLPEEIRMMKVLVNRDPARIWQQVQSLLETYPSDPDLQSASLQIAAKAATGQEFVEFVRRHKSWVRRQPMVDVDVMERLLAEGCYESAELMLTATLAKTPDAPLALQRYADLLLREGRHWEAVFPLRTLLRQNSIPLEQLIFLCGRREILEDESGLRLAAEREPGAGVLTGLGAWEFSQNRFPGSEEFYEAATQESRQLPAAWAGLGMTFFRQGDPQSRLSAWRHLAEKLEPQHPDVLFLMAWLDEQQGQTMNAIRLLHRAISLDPLHRPSNQALGVLLSQSETSRETGMYFVQRAGLIDQFELHMHEMLFGDRSLSDFIRAAELSERLGDPEIALAWLSGTALFDSSDQTGAVIPDKEELRRVAATNRDSLRANLALAKQSQVEPRERKPEGRPLTDVASDQEFTFVDRSAEVGLTIPYHGGITDFDSGLKIYQGFGGGVAVLDFDRDSRPDIYFTQASQWPTVASLPSDQQDLIYRQRGNRFDQVNELAAPSEAGFGQGVAVGDFDRDGFDDLYVANIGVNRLLLNNGDGTFRSVSFAADSVSEWTSSCLMADLNGDGFDDLFDVCYVAGEEPFTRVCGDVVDGIKRERSCLPSLFEPASDRVWLSQGDGSVHDASVSSGVSESQGRGLGIVAGDFDGVPGVELFVSNDMSANHFWKQNRAATDFRVTEQAEIHGLARNGEGQLEACMGIAAADFSADGEMDLVVTNFLNETNTYYQSIGAGFFRDQSEVGRIGIHSRTQLGFGAQPIDVDLDGDFDLLVANGHVDDYSHLGAAFRMKVDVFENSDAGVFRKSSQNAAGEYGQLNTLGRAVARTDWNRDGRDDLLIAHLDRQPALLENCTESHAGFVSLKLIGVESNRPAVGAVVRVESGGRVFVLQQTAGDGYYCSNERRLQLGGIQAELIDKIEVRWPTGTVTLLHQVPANQRLSIVEGRTAAYRDVP